jgi:conjugal transfer pilus assembly protein TraW
VNRRPVLICAALLAAASGTPFAAQVFARDHGQMGEVFPIIEVDLLSTIEARLRKLESSGRLAALQEQMRDQAIRSVRRPAPVEGLGSAIAKRSWLFDPSMVVEADIKDDKGNLIAARGQRINPMAFVKLAQELVFVDGSNKAELDWAVANWSQVKAKIIFVDGSPFDMMKPYQRRFYFDQGGQLVGRFGIRNTPAIVSAEGDMLRVVETPLKAAGS